MTAMKATLQRNIIRAARASHDAWLVTGVTIVLILLVESAYRAETLAKRTVADWRAHAPTAEPPSPFDTIAWAAEYRRDHLQEEAVQWAPYVELRNPTFQGRHISVDSLGHRVTPMAASKSGRTVRVFFLGGSTTFGWYQRAAHTIPAEAARRLQALLGDSAHIEVTNFGVPGHTFTLETLELLLELRAGARPDVVVFYDGINDVMATVQNRRAGAPQNAANRAEDFVRGRDLAAEKPPGIANDLRTARRLFVSALLRLQFVQRITEIRRPGEPAPVPIDSLARSVVHLYSGNARIVEALAASYGFEPIYIWQPALLSTRKPLTPRETWLRRPQRVGNLHMAIPKLIGPAMASVAGGRFIDATDLFDADSLDVFVDTFGHTYERANPRVVDTLMPNLAAAVSRALSRAHQTPPH